MKIRFFTFIITTISIYSCATKTIAPTIETPKTEPVVVAENVVKTTDDELVQGKSILESQCVRCHGIYDPKEFDKKEWKDITNRMQKKAHLSDVEINKVYNYIVFNLK